MNGRGYESMHERFRVNRRDFLKVSTAVGAGILLGTPDAWAQEQERKPPAKPATNLKDYLDVPRTAHSLPGPFPGRVVEIHDPRSVVEGKPDAAVIAAMFEKGLQTLTGREPTESFQLLFNPEDVVGIKVNPVGSGLISTRLELVDAIVAWLEANGLPRRNIVVWDRFDYMLQDAGFTAERYPGIGIEGLQTMDEAAMEEGATDDSRWLDSQGRHVSEGQFDREMSYWVDVEGPKDRNYLNQHVFNGKDSYFGKLITRRLTKIINVPVYKNTGNGISIATKNIGYGAICNTGRLHQPIGFEVNTEVSAFPCIRDKWVLTVADGLVAQYEGGPMPNAQFTYDWQRLYLATDPFALDMICQQQIVAKRKEMGIDVNEHPRYTDYLHYGEKLGLGIADTGRIEHVTV